MIRLLFYLELRKAGIVGTGEELPDKKLTARIIQAAITVHKALGPGFLESIYEDSWLLLNFATMPLTVKRVVRESPPPSRLPEFQMKEYPLT